MNDIWWSRGRGETQARMVPGLKPTVIQPELLPAEASQVAAMIRERLPAFTPSWTNFRPDDPGQVWLRLFAEQMTSVRTRLNRLPEKAFVEFLRIAGIKLLPPTCAAAMLQITVSKGATRSVLVPKGFAAAARPADGTGELVIFETQRNLFALPGEILQAYLRKGGMYNRIDILDSSDKGGFEPLGAQPEPGDAWIIGIDAEFAPSPTLTLGIEVSQAPGTPPPVSFGSTSPVSSQTGPLLRWEALDKGTFVPVEVILDDTAGLARSGIVEIRPPKDWSKASLAGVEKSASLLWLRLRLVYGGFENQPRLNSVRLNMVSAKAARTIRNEVLLTKTRGDSHFAKLEHRPVIPGTLVLRVAEGSDTQEWQQVENLADYDGDARVYELDESTAELQFGDGLRGAQLPQGFRNVVAESYLTGGGMAGAVDKEQITILLSSAPFVTGVSNPQAASGGTDSESSDSARLRGPQEIRARGRAVTAADYNLLAKRAPGAEVMRAHAVPGLHPNYPGEAIPGVVGVFVLPPDRGEGPPIPDEGTLRSVAEYLSVRVAPCGVEVVAAAPLYQSISTKINVVVTPNWDVGEVVGQLINVMNNYFHPLKGGPLGDGWPFGGTIEYAPLMRRLLAIGGVSAIPRLRLVLDGVRNSGECASLCIAPNALLWPGSHEIIPTEIEARA